MEVSKLTTHTLPNILWISFEDTSPRFGCYGDDLAVTPNIDRLAAEGVVFQNAFSTAAVCSPSRCSVITSMYAPSIGANHHRTSTPQHTNELPTPYEAVPPAYVKLLPEYLRLKGYFCTNNGKTDYQFTAPFTAWDENGNEAHWRNRKQNQPFFSVFNLDVTHESGMWRAYDQLETDPASVQLPPYLPDTEKSRKALALHYDNLKQADQMAGTLLKQLEEDGLYENTIVFIWSDHGEGLPRSKRWLYDSGIRVPLIVRWPEKVEPNTTSEQLVSMIDLAPTVLSVLGFSIPGHMQGKPFLGEKNDQRDYVYAARDRHDEGYDMVRAVRDSKYKYIRNFHPEKPYFHWIPYGHNHAILQEIWRLYANDELKGPQQLLTAKERPVDELYDCEDDPFEINNLAEDPKYQTVLKRMRNELERWRDKIGDKGDIPEEQMVHTMWPNGIQPQTSSVQFVPIDKNHSGSEPMQEGDTYQAPALLMLDCATQGASIAYTFEESEPQHWRLYNAPLQLPVGNTRIHAKAIRIGYKPSEQTSAVFDVTNQE